MNWKFWQIRKANAQIEALSATVAEAAAECKQTPVHLFNPDWPRTRSLFLDRLANTVPTDALMTGVLGVIEQELLIQVQRCEAKKLTETETVQICAAIGVLAGLRGDLERKWHEQLARKVNAEAKTS